MTGARAEGNRFFWRCIRPAGWLGGARYPRNGSASELASYGWAGAEVGCRSGFMPRK